MGDVGCTNNVAVGKASTFAMAEMRPPDAELGKMFMALPSGLGEQYSKPKTWADAAKNKTIFLIFPNSRMSPH